MSCTVKDLASTCGITPQYVLIYIKKQGLEKRLDKSGKAFLVPDDVAQQLVEHFRYKDVEKEQPNNSQDYTVSSSDLIAAYKRHISDLQRDKEELREENKRLLVELQKLLDQNALLSSRVDELITTNRTLAGTNALQEYDRVRPDNSGVKDEIEIDAVEESQEPTQEQKQEQPKEEKKRGFWAWLLGL